FINGKIVNTSSSTSRFIFFCKNATVVNHGFGLKSPNLVCVCLMLF
ncbi:unnamed protein product, partial [Brassica rapa subsp. trilocularis]